MPSFIVHVDTPSPAESHVGVELHPPLPDDDDEDVEVDEPEDDELEPAGQSELKLSAFASSSQVLPSRQVSCASVRLLPQSCPHSCEAASAEAWQLVALVWQRELHSCELTVADEPDDDVEDDELDEPLAPVVDDEHA